MTDPWHVAHITRHGDEYQVTVPGEEPFTVDSPRVAAFQARRLVARRQFLLMAVQRAETFGLTAEDLATFLRSL